MNAADAVSNYVEERIEKLESKLKIQLYEVLIALKQEELKALEARIKELKA